jgi:hypothetical protein
VPRGQVALQCHEKHQLCECVRLLSVVMLQHTLHVKGYKGGRVSKRVKTEVEEGVGKRVKTEVEVRSNSVKGEGLREYCLLCTGKCKCFYEKAVQHPHSHPDRPQQDSEHIIARLVPSAAVQCAPNLSTKSIVS